MLSKAIPKDWVSVAKIGRSLGFKGDVLLHLLSDFPQSLKAGNSYHSQFGDLTLEYYSPNKSTAKFKEINSKEEAKQIVNCVLYSTQEETKAQCVLEDNAFFWFEIIGSKIVENGEILGIVSEIDRFCNQDYLMITTDSALLTQKLPKSFLIPYNARYILNVESQAQPKIIHTQFCKDILENS
ncbi:16S rRNA processing protein RimM [Helicobacter sp. MIT 11-5569]|uniref:ribosome maturation factor RimM n=1 Tax=Helicobacter sp. MIT 11-5569 TaxID=1548151 RepID=UPI00051FD603|nr:ribosome maturation factor RimM [Helicobacter sp. MIT 11-5569]TLD82917.1 16S rRNA processing protein RimM [Helicobacter sp. MIT 11-5569]